MTLYSEEISDGDIFKPNYSTLMKWWQAWPEARPELLDFWARGGYVQRSLWRQNNPQPALTIGVRYIDEIESAIRNLALLGVEIDFIWVGDVSPVSLVITPQDVDYEGVGGWGYTTCSGDRVDDARGGREWVPTMAWAQMMPDTVTDWIFDNAFGFFENGECFIAPAESVGLSRNMEKGVSQSYERFNQTTTMFDPKVASAVISNLDIPKIDGMSVRDLSNFRRDHDPELKRFRNAIANLLSASEGNVDQCLAEIKDAIREIESSNSYASMRKSVIGIGAALATFNFGLAEGVAAKALGAGFAAHTALQWWCERTIANREARSKPFWPVWKLGKGKRRGEFHRARTGLQAGAIPMDPTPNRISHWLAPPEPGWTIPSAIQIPT